MEEVGLGLEEWELRHSNVERPSRYDIPAARRLKITSTQPGRRKSGFERSSWKRKSLILSLCGNLRRRS